MISDPAEHLLTGAADANLAYEQYMITDIQQQRWYAP